MRVQVYKSIKAKNYKGELKEVLDYIRTESIGKVGVELSKSKYNKGFTYMKVELIENELIIYGKFDIDGCIDELHTFIEGQPFSRWSKLESMFEFETFYSKFMKIRESKNGVDYKFFGQLPEEQNVYFRKEYNDKKLKGDLKSFIKLLRKESSFDIDVQITNNSDTIVLDGILINGEYYFDAYFNKESNTLVEIVIAKMTEEDGVREPEYYNVSSLEEFKEFFVRFNEMFKLKNELYDLYNIVKY